jgi:hypothetical protein
MPPARPPRPLAALAPMALGALACLSALAAPAARAAPAIGASLETPTGERLFPSLVGEPMPGWLRDFDAPARRIAYPGHGELRALGGGTTLAIVRADELVGAYALRAGRCIGQALFEPRRAPAPLGWDGAEEPAEALEARWRREGFRAQPGFLATRDRAYALDVQRLVRRRAGQIEKRWLVAWPDRGVLAPDPALGASAPVRWCQAGEARYPAGLAAAMRVIEEEGELGLAERARRERQR